MMTVLGQKVSKLELLETIKGRNFQQLMEELKKLELVCSIFEFVGIGLKEIPGQPSFRSKERGYYHRCATSVGEEIAYNGARQLVLWNEITGGRKEVPHHHSLVIVSMPQIA
jgi:hypothetical protein